jgi:hypothetical protein
MIKPEKHRTKFLMTTLFANCNLHDAFNEMIFCGKMTGTVTLGQHPEKQVY